MSYGLIKNFIKDQDGDVYLNQLLRYMRGCVLVPRETNNPLAIPANSISSEIILEGPQDATTELFALNGFHAAGTAADVSNRLTVQITDTWMRRQLMNKPVLVDHVFGSNLQQMELMETLLLQGQQTLSFTFQNNSAGGEAAFSFCGRGSKIQNASISEKYAEKRYNDIVNRKTFLYPFWMTLDGMPSAFTVPAATTRRAFMSNTSDIEIMLSWAMGRVITTGVAGDTDQIIKTSIIDPETGDPLQSAPVSFGNMFGPGATFPRPLSTPIIMPPNTQIFWDITNLITDQPTDVYITLCGVANYQGQALSSVVNKGYVVPAPFMAREV